MKEDDKELAQQFASRVRDRFHDAAVWVFGSRSRGDATPESDLDCLVVINNPDPEARRTIREIAWEVGFEKGVVITTIVLGREEFEDGPMSKSTLVANVLEEGAQL